MLKMLQIIIFIVMIIALLVPISLQAQVIPKEGLLSITPGEMKTHVSLSDIR